MEIFITCGDTDERGNKTIVKIPTGIKGTTFLFL